METYTPQYLDKWTLPPYYMGEEWPEYYVFLSQSRDSDCLTRSNFRCALSQLQAIPSEYEHSVQVVRESHWAVGWVEWIAIHEGDVENLRLADTMAKKIEGYPVLNEEDFSMLEMEEANEIWANCYDWKERIEYIRKHRGQFEFRSFSDILNCVRGKYFSGYASELIH